MGNQALLTLVSVVVIIASTYLWIMNHKKSKPRYEYFRRLCRSLHYLNDKAIMIEQMILMIEDIENTPKETGKCLTIAVPETLTKELNVGKFTIRNAKDSEIFRKVIDDECADLCTSLLLEIDEAVSTGTIKAYDESIDLNLPESGERDKIPVFVDGKERYRI